jgi:rhamnosyltransferase
MKKVFIALATYQGARFLRPLIQSIRRQSVEAWTLLVRDDGSSDATVDILREAAARDNRIHIIRDGGQRLGSAGNFGVVMQRAYELGADYLFLADQDDVWHTDKIGNQLEVMRDGEMAAGKQLAHLVYSDLVVVNELRQTVHPSFFACSRLSRGGSQPLRTLLGRSFVLGCASAINRPLLELALPLPSAIASHDWWTALCAASAGRISYLPQPTLWYRRHGSNSSGPADFWAGLNPWHYSWRKRWNTGYCSFHQSITQVLTLRRRLEDRTACVATETQQCLDQFCELFERSQPAWRRIYKLLSTGLPAIDLPRRLLYYLCVMAIAEHENMQPIVEQARKAA